MVGARLVASKGVELVDYSSCPTHLWARSIWPLLLFTLRLDVDITKNFTWQARRMAGFFFRSPRNQNFSIKVRGLVLTEGETATRSVPHKPFPMAIGKFPHTAIDGYIIL